MAEQFIISSNPIKGYWFQRELDKDSKNEAATANAIMKE